MIRIGNGYDVHRLAVGRKLILGGVEIVHDTGLAGHSDADVCVHAVMDAMLGALALYDIGRHFPDNDPQYEGASSIKLLTQVNRIINEKGYEIGNIDVTIAAQSPKLAPYIDKMRENIAAALSAGVENISVKATTTEKLGFVGREEGISAYAVCTVVKR